MIILIWYLLFNIVLPQLVVTTAAIAFAFSLPAIIIIVIAVTVGLKTGNVGNTVVNGFFKAIGFIFSQIFKAIGYIFKQLVQLTPLLYRNSKKFYSSIFKKGWLSSLFAILTVIIIWIIII